MILRRVIEHVKAQNWTAVGLDFVIVVMGVFIGIQVSNWNNARANRAIGASYADRLRDDLNIETSTWKGLEAYYRTTRNHAAAALEGFQKDATALDQQFLIDLYQASQRTNAPLVRGTFDELLSTGRIELVADPETRRIVSNHYGRQSATELTQNERTEYRRVIRELMDSRVQDAIRSSCGDQYVRNGQNFIYIVLPEGCAIDLPDDLVTQEVSRLHGNEEIQRALRFHMSVLDGRLGSLGNVIESAQSTLKVLEPQE